MVNISFKIGRQVCGKLQILTCYGMIKTDGGCVQTLAFQQFVAFFAAIHRITGYRMAKTCHLHADLVCSACKEV